MRFQSEISNDEFIVVSSSYGKWVLRLSIHPFIYSFNSFSEAWIAQPLSAFWNEVPGLKEPHV